MEIIEAKQSDIPVMNEIILAAKSHWGYSDELIEIWRPELLVDPSSLRKRTFWLLKYNGRIAGVISVSRQSEGVFELEDCWVEPNCIGLGAGKFMFNFVVDWLETNDATVLRIMADPNAAGFYERMGARFIKMEPSLPKGREIPLFGYTVGNK